MIGLPVVMDGHPTGYVMRGVLTDDGRALRGIVMRGGLRGVRWLPREQIALVGKISVIAQGKPRRMPKEADYRLFRVSDPDGMRLGIVTDALLNEDTLRVAALEISAGPIDDLTEGRWYAMNYAVQPHGALGHVTISLPREEVTGP